jgi:hypothetical protein
MATAPNVDESVSSASRAEAAPRRVLRSAMISTSSHSFRGAARRMAIRSRPFASHRNKEDDRPSNHPVTRWNETPPGVSCKMHCDGQTQLRLIQPAYPCYRHRQPVLRRRNAGRNRHVICDVHPLDPSALECLGSPSRLPNAAAVFLPLVSLFAHSLRPCGGDKINPASLWNVWPILLHDCAHPSQGLREA